MIITACLFSYPPARYAGADLYNAHQLEALARAGHDVRVFTTQKMPAQVRNGVKVHGHARDYPRGTQVVYTAPDAGGNGPVLAARTGAKLVGVVHNTAKPTGAAILRRRWDLLVWNSHATRDAHNGTGGLIVRPPVCVPDLDSHADPNCPWPCCAGNSGDAVTIINLSEDKGARVWWELAARNPHTPFLGVMSWGPQLVNHPEGKYCPNVQLLPTVPHDRMGEAVWARTRVLLAPSKSEAWGMAAVEALAHGIPVIAHPTPGLRESLGDAGTYIDRCDLDQWARALAALDRFGANPWLMGIKRARELATLTQHDTAAFVTAVEGLA